MEMNKKHEEYYQWVEKYFDPMSERDLKKVLNIIDSPLKAIKVMINGLEDTRGLILEMDVFGYSIKDKGRMTYYGGVGAAALQELFDKAFNLWDVGCIQEMARYLHIGVGTIERLNIMFDRMRKCDFMGMELLYDIQYLCKIQKMANKWIKNKRLIPFTETNIDEDEEYILYLWDNFVTELETIQTK